MKRAHVYEQIRLILLGGIALTLPFAQAVNHAFIIAALLLTLCSGSTKQGWSRLIRHPLAVVCFVFFALHLSGILFSDNTQEAAAIAGRRLSMLVFPLLLLAETPAATVRKVLLVFAAACMAALGYCLIHAAWRYHSGGEASVFFYHSLSNAVGLNAVYFSAYLVFSIHILLRETSLQTGAYKMFCIISILLCVAGCILLSSKMLLFVLMAGVVAHFLCMHAVSVRTKVLGVALAVLVPVTAALLLPSLRQRMVTEAATNMQVVNREHYRYDTPFTGTSLRLTIWRFCSEILTERKAWLTGAGTGDFQQLLNERYRAAGIYTGDARLRNTGYTGYGPHNQYVETTFALGLSGLAVFLLLMTLLWRTALKNGDLLLIQLALLLALFCLSESVLSTSKGIVFFLFFMFLLVSKKKEPAS